MTTCHRGDEGRAGARNRAESRAEEEGENWSCCAAARGIFQGSKWSRTPFQLLSSPPPVSHPLHAKHRARETKGNTGSSGDGSEESSSGTKERINRQHVSFFYFKLFISLLIVHSFLRHTSLVFRSRRAGRRWPAARHNRPRLSPSVRLPHRGSPTRRPNYLHLMI